MGYYTRYRLAVTIPPGQEKIAMAEPCGECGQSRTIERDTLATIRAVLVDDEWARLGSLIDGDADESKWYEHEAEMRRVSARFPGVLFKLSGEGAESGDIWTKWFRDGKMQHGKTTIVLDEFDEGKLS